MTPMIRTPSLLFRLHIDVPLLGGVLVTCALGLVVLYSASEQSADVVLRQALRILIGLGAMVAIAQVSPRRLARWAPALYVLGLALLVLVLIVGIGRGAQRWLAFGVMRFQPSELMKLAVPLTVAAFMADKVLPPGWHTVCIAALLVCVPAALIAEQPDLGTAILVATSACSWSTSPASPGADHQQRADRARGRAARLIAMHDYQRRRVLTLFDRRRSAGCGLSHHPVDDRGGIGWHVR